MGKEKFVFKIDNPCNEDWDKMDKAADGKFCSSCQKMVFDFTNLSDEKLVAFARQYPDGFCGRLAQHQINNTISCTPEKKFQFLNGIAATALTAFTLLSDIKGFAQTTKTEVVASLKSVQKGADFSSQAKGLSDKKVYGHVIDSTNKGTIGVSDVVVKIEGTDSCFTTTDRWGYYELSVPEKCKRTMFRVTFEKSGYYFGEPFPVRYKELPFNYNFYVDADVRKEVVVTAGIVIVQGFKDRPWWKKMFKRKKLRKNCN